MRNTPEDIARQDALYADEPWAKLAVRAGFRPYDTESMARHAFASCAEFIAELEAKIENAGLAACETQPSWERRCYAIMAALGLDYGEPSPDIPEQNGWYARNLAQKDREIEKLQAALRMAKGGETE